LGSFLARGGRAGKKRLEWRTPPPGGATEYGHPFSKSHIKKAFQEGHVEQSGRAEPSRGGIKWDHHIQLQNQGVLLPRPREAARSLASWREKGAENDPYGTGEDRRPPFFFFDAKR